EGVVTSTDRERKTREVETVVHAGNLPFRLAGSPNLAFRARRVVAAVAIGVRCAECVTNQERTRGELEWTGIPEQRGRRRRVAKHFDDLPAADDDDGVAL